MAVTSVADVEALRLPARVEACLLALAVDCAIAKRTQPAARVRVVQPDVSPADVTHLKALGFPPLLEAAALGRRIRLAVIGHTQPAVVLRVVQRYQAANQLQLDRVESLDTEPLP